MLAKVAARLDLEKLMPKLALSKMH
jgi:hypothetical protein